MNRQIKSNTAFRLYFLIKIKASQSFFGRSNCDAFWENEDKIHEGGCVKEFFFVNLQAGISSTSFQINFFTTFSDILSKWTPSNGYFLFLYKMLEKHLWNSFLLYLVVEFLQLVYETSSFPEVLYKRSVLKNFPKITDKQKKQSSGNFRQGRHPLTLIFAWFFCGNKYNLLFQTYPSFSVFDILRPSFLHVFLPL